MKNFIQLCAGQNSDNRSDFFSDDSDQGILPIVPHDEESSMKELHSRVPKAPAKGMRAAHSIAENDKYLKQKHTFAQPPYIDSEATNY
jgi:hypothetical protein